MKRLVFKRLIGQSRVREVLSTAFARGALGHAYLFCGDEGVGTLQAAVDLAMGLLCESSGDVPCGICAGCVKVMHNSHEDLTMVVPVVLSKEHRSDETLSAKGWECVSEVVCARIEQPYRRPLDSRIATIAVDWIREVDRAVQRGPLSGPTAVAILCAPELMRRESANALLKTLEEPPAGTHFILCSESPHAVLPTIRSRCQLLRFGTLSDTEVAQGLRRLHPDALAPAQLADILASAQGSLGAALACAADPHPEAQQAAQSLWNMLTQSDTLACATAIDRLAATLEPASCERMLACCMHAARNTLLLSAGLKTPWVTHETTLPGGVACAVTPRRARRLLALCRRGMLAARGHAVVPLLLAAFVYEAREILHG